MGRFPLDELMVAYGLPGAGTPTTSQTRLGGFVENEERTCDVCCLAQDFATFDAAKASEKSPSPGCLIDAPKDSSGA